MFKKSRRKIVLAIMSVLTALLLGTMAVIYLTSYFEMRYDNYQMLQRHAQTYVLRLEGGGQFQPIDPGKNPFDDRPSFRLATFYSVAISEEGYILATDTGNTQLYQESYLVNRARKVIDSGKVRGVEGNLLYLVAQKQGYQLVVFMDNTIVQERMSSLLRNTLVFGSVTIVAVFFLAVYLARKIVKPLEESYRKQKQFISDAGHELKTPVSVVSANAELLGRELGENQWLSNIQYENERMGCLVKQLLDLAKTEDVGLQMQHLNFSRLVSGEILPFESVAFERGLELKTEIMSDLFINGDAGKLKQLVSILIDNAIDHSQGGRDIQVRLCGEHNQVKLSVINQGPQISKEATDQMFERFYRADESRRDNGHFGLGLAIAKAIVEAHKGKISVDCYDGNVEFMVVMPQLR